MINWQKLKKSISKIGSFSELQKISWVWRSVVIIFFFIILILLAVYVKREALKNLLAPSSTQTIYESLPGKIQAIDQIIFQQLSKLSITKDYISLKHFQTKEGTSEWNYSLITVTLPPNITLNQIKNALKRGFSFFEIEGLKWHFSHTEVNCLKIDVHIQGIKTHQLIFSYPASSLDKQKTTKGVYKVSIVIDDLGENYTTFKKLLEMNIPFTYSILPFLPYSARIAREAYENDREVILHLPLEPWDSVNQKIAYGTLLTSMQEEQLLAQLERDINAVPCISGISNHMGSKFTEDKDKMEMVLKRMKEKGLYFFDSRTTKKTFGYTLAKAMNIKTAERDLFIDNNPEPLAIEQQLKKIPLLAKKNGGYAIAIGHPHSSTIDELRKIIPFFNKQNVTIVPLSQLVN